MQATSQSRVENEISYSKNTIDTMAMSERLNPYVNLIAYLEGTSHPPLILPFHGLSFDVQTDHQLSLHNRTSSSP